MTSQKQIELCEYCKTEISGNFCSNCGRARTLKRINSKYIISQIGSILNFDKGILFTIKELLIRPGQSVQIFIHKDRKTLVKPIVFIIICSLTYTILQRLFNFKDGYVNYSFGDDITSTSIFDWVTNNYGYANLLLAIFIALWIRLFFRKHNYNLFEILILLCFVMGVGMLIFSFFGMIDSLSNLKIADKGFLIGVLYISWGIGLFFKGNKLVNSIKGLLCYFLGLISFTLIILVLGTMIDWISP